MTINIYYAYCEETKIGTVRKTRAFDQIKDIPDSYVAADGIIIGAGNKIPLCLFRFLY